MIQVLACCKNSITQHKDLPSWYSHLSPKVVRLKCTEMRSLQNNYCFWLKLADPSGKLFTSPGDSFDFKIVDKRGCTRALYQRSLLQFLVWACRSHVVFAWAYVYLVNSEKIFWQVPQQAVLFLQSRVDSSTSASKSKSPSSPNMIGQTFYFKIVPAPPALTQFPK